MAIVISSQIFFLSIRSRLTFVGLLFFLGSGFGLDAQAGCWDLLRAKPALIAEQNLFEQIHPANIAVDWPQLLRDEFGVDRVRFGWSFDVATWPYHVVTLKRPRDLDPRTLAQYNLDFSRFLFEVKRREYRYGVRPDRYIQALERLTLKLEPVVYASLEILHPETGVEAKRRFAATRLALRSLLLFGPGKVHLWPLEGGTAEARHKLQTRRQLLHWGLSRSVAALYITTLSMSLVQLPELLGEFSLLYKMRGELVELGKELGKGVPYDRRLEREKLIVKYEMRIENMMKELEAGTELNPDLKPEKLKAQIADLQAAVSSMRAELKAMTNKN